MPHGSYSPGHSGRGSRRYLNTQRNRSSRQRASCASLPRPRLQARQVQRLRCGERAYFFLQVHFVDGFLHVEQTPSLIEAPQTLQGLQPHDWHMISFPLSSARNPAVSQMTG